ncbi:MAG: alpha/beta hydrolase [Acidobacteriia bacterium]|nr:alpha/beta hydrolase [Terriglobia bacterium]
MRAKRVSFGVLFASLLMLSCVATPMSAGQPVNLTASDGTLLKATYFAAAKLGPGVLLLHQCNQQRKSWDVLAARLAEAGINVLTVDYRGFGESGGAPFDKLTPQEQNKIVTDTWPGDIDVAFQYLVSQPGVTRDVVGAGGASCGVNNSIRLARRHPEVKSLVLLSGGTDREGRLFLESSKNLPVFTSAAEDDAFGRLTEMMQWLFSVSSNPASRFEHYAKGGHGVEMFAVHPELLSRITEWWGATLMKRPVSPPKANGSPLEPRVLSTLELIDQPGGAGKAGKTLAEARVSDPKASLFPEFIVNLLGYEHLQRADTKGAVEILKLNVTAYPQSPNVYDSLSDAYLADGQKDLALENAKKALELLAKDTIDPDQRRNAIRDSAEQKLKQLGQTRP